MVNSDILDRFWSKVDKSGGEDACWPWLGCKNEEGYGNFRYEGHTRKAHVLAYEFTYNRSIPRPLVAHHECSHKWCCNPRHVRGLTRAEHSLRGIELGEIRREDHQGERNGNALLTAEKVVEARSLYPKISIGELATRYGVTRSTMDNVIFGRSWKHVEGAHAKPGGRKPYTHRKQRPLKGKKLTLEQVDQIRASRGVSQAELSRQYGVQPSVISNILNGKIWVRREQSQPEVAHSKNGRPPILPQSKIDEIRKLYSDGYRQKLIASICGVSQSYVSRVVAGDARRAE